MCLSCLTAIPEVRGSITGYTLAIFMSDIGTGTGSIQSRGDNNCYLGKKSNEIRQRQSKFNLKDNALLSKRPPEINEII